MGATPSRPPVGPTRVAGGIAVVLAALAAGGVGGRVFWTVGTQSFAAVTTGGPSSPTDLLLLGACVLGLGLTAWLGLGVLLATAAALPGAAGRAGGLVAERFAPALVRRAVVVALGGALMAGLPVAAHADTPRPGPVATQVGVAPAPDPAFAVTGGSLSVDGSTTPAPTSTGSTPTSTPSGTTTGPAASTTAPDPGFAVTSPTPAPSTTPVAPTPRPAPTLGPLGPASGRTAPADSPTATPTHTTATAPIGATIRVQRGDTLWGIAARHLGGHATPAAVVAEWHRWYAANRAVVGADPDRIVPGQELTAPSAAPSSTPSSTSSSTPGAPS